MDAWQWHHGAGGGWLATILVALLVFVVVALLVYALLRGRNGHAASARSTPAEIVAERYARGEIEREEYLQKLEDLRR